MDCNLNHCKFAPMTIEAANRLIISSLTGIYDEREASSVSSLVMERLTGMPKNLRILHKSDPFTNHQQALFEEYLSDLMRNRPVQYVLGEAWFGPLSFFVDENVLIPRPETEELADWLIQEAAVTEPSKSILDIGTGSGCISVYIKKKQKALRVMALDISEEAVEIAKKNARLHDTEIEFFLCNILDPLQWESLDSPDLIISNPPYIPENQKEKMEKHVKDFEPALALFVPDSDPIIFYKIIGNFAIQKLKPGGRVFLEIHHDYSNEVMAWYEEKGFSLELKKDFSGNNRMIKAFLP
jgi:release factor glutamine methyltransferase